MNGNLAGPPTHRRFAGASSFNFVVTTTVHYVQALCALVTQRPDNLVSSGCPSVGTGEALVDPNVLFVGQQVITDWPVYLQWSQRSPASTQIGQGR